MHIFNNRAITYMKQKLPELNEEIDKSTITLAYSNISFPIIDRKSIHKSIRLLKI